MNQNKSLSEIFDDLRLAASEFMSKVDALKEQCEAIVPSEKREPEDPESPFRTGDRVLVRDDNDEEWRYSIFDDYNPYSNIPYTCEGDGWRQCIPYNERTWPLLGTTEAYNQQTDN